MLLFQLLILASGASRRQSALHIAAKTGDLSTVNRLLLQRGAPLDNVDWTSETPLLKAARFGRAGVVAALLEAGAMSQVQPSLAVAARYGHGAVVQLLIQAGADPDASDQRGDYDTPLMVASTYGQSEAVQALLKGGAQANARTSRVGRTALICAAIEGHATVVRILLEGGAEVDLPDEFGTVPLEFAAHGGHLKAVKELVDGGASIDSSGSRNVSTALMVASMQGAVQVVELLIAAGANPNARTIDNPFLFLINSSE